MTSYAEKVAELEKQGWTLKDGKMIRVIGPGMVQQMARPNTAAEQKIDDDMAPVLQKLRDKRTPFLEVADAVGHIMGRVDGSWPFLQEHLTWYFARHVDDCRKHNAAFAARMIAAYLRARPNGSADDLAGLLGRLKI